jgi:hypothetical protein
VKYYILSTAFYGAENWTLRKVDQKYLGKLKMWYWRRIEISWKNHVRNEGVLHTVKEKRNILRTINRGKANTLPRNCLLKHVIEGKTEGTRR